MGDLNALSPQQRSTLVSLMMQYINDAIVAEHPLLDHFDRHLFTHHEQYVRAMEDWIRARPGGAGFVPLPKWNPANPIPPEFNIVKPRDNGVPRPPLQNLNPNRPRSAEFGPQAVCGFPNTDAVANQMNGWHGSVHIAIGGTMADADIASAAPIFWPWHKYVNESYEDRLRCQGWTGFLIQSRFGAKGNFELVTARPRGGLYHFWRNNDSGMRWGGGQVFATDAGDSLEHVILIQGNFGNNLELVVRIRDRLAHFWRQSNAPWTWYGTGFFASGIGGNPTLLQSNFGTKGNFEVVAPRAGGGMVHYWRNNDGPGFPWSGPTPFAASVGNVDAVAMIQGNFGKNLELVARIGTRLAHFWRESAPPWRWHGPNFFFEGAAGGPALIQSRHGLKGNFEVVTPLANGRMAHLWRNNDLPTFPWSAPTVFGPDASWKISGVSLIQGNYGNPGNLEVAARIDGRIAHFWRLGVPPWTWSGPTVFV